MWRLSRLETPEAPRSSLASAWVPVKEIGTEEWGSFSNNKNLVMLSAVNFAYNSALSNHSPSFSKRPRIGSLSSVVACSVPFFYSALSSFHSPLHNLYRLLCSLLIPHPFLVISIYNAGFKTSLRPQGAGSNMPSSQHGYRFRRSKPRPQGSPEHSRGLLLHQLQYVHECEAGQWLISLQRRCRKTWRSFAPG